MGEFPRKILVSPGFGAGWSTWATEDEQWLAEYQPLIEAIESKDAQSIDAAVAQCAKEYEDRTGRRLYLGGANQLKVVTVNSPYRIEEYDGSESVLERDDPKGVFFD